MYVSFSIGSQHPEINLGVWFL